jgi:hypothetical protein
MSKISFTKDIIGNDGKMLEQLNLLTTALDAAHSTIRQLEDRINKSNIGTGGDATIIDTGGLGRFITLAPTGVTAGAYTDVNLTVGADGRIYAISNGAGSGSAVWGLITGTLSDQTDLYNQLLFLQALAVAL